jgi:hypothetical protein
MNRLILIQSDQYVINDLNIFHLGTNKFQFIYINFI